MASGSQSQSQRTIDESDTHVSETQHTYIDVDDDETVHPSAAASGGSQSKIDKDSSKPPLSEVTFHGARNSKNPGGNKQWTCIHCKDKFTSTYTRIHVHFFGAAVGKKTEIKRCSAVLRDRGLYERLFTKKGIVETFGALERNVVDLKIERGLCANGIPFNVLRNPHFLEMIYAIRNAPVGYKPPSSEKARTVLLDECVRDVEKELAPVKDTWYTQGVSTVSDGWSNVIRSPLINELAVNSRSAMFMYAEDFLGVEKTGVEIANFLNGAIETIGPSNVLSVVTDNAANSKAAGKESEKVYPHIFWSPCCVHTLNLIFKDMVNAFFWMFETYKRGKDVVKYFLIHTHALAIFKENSKIELLKVAKTRFASHYILLSRLLKCREALATVTVLNSWRELMKSGDENSRTTGENVAKTINDDLFWEDVENILAITKPIYLLVKFCDGEGPRM
ncbi:uncharacterized protein LOC143580184 [Bidens hawaiensis]|uniref:uncharacterized protein LOC143580184 n=1 Tax=Bidens hawaiensis TaxID=980011 RepID=UPI00404B5700